MEGFMKRLSLLSLSYSGWSNARPVQFYRASEQRLGFRPLFTTVVGIFSPPLPRFSLAHSEVEIQYLYSVVPTPS